MSAEPVRTALVSVNQSTNAEVYRASTDAADLCREIVMRTAQNIQGRKYVKVEGWQAIAVAHGCTASARSVERVDGGVRAVGEIRRMSDGSVIAEAEGFVGEDEPTWYGGEVIAYGKKKTLPKRADYAIRAMAQTRAISRACRSAFAHVVVMIDGGLSTTPAEEVPEGGFNDRTVDGEFTPVTDKPADESAAVKAASVAISQCKATSDLDAWYATNKDVIDILSKAEIKAIVDVFQARVSAVSNVTPFDKAA